MTMTVKSLGNLAVLRTFRVLRALKTVAVVPGKTVIRELQALSVSRIPKCCTQNISRIQFCWLNTQKRMMHLVMQDA